MANATNDVLEPTCTVHLPRMVLYVNMPCEVGAAALYSVLDPYTKVIGMEIHQAEDLDYVLKAIDIPENYMGQIVMIGTYWKKIWKHLIARRPYTEFVVFSPSEFLADEEFMGNLSVVSAVETKQGPATFLFDLAQKRSPTPKLMTLFAHHFRAVMQHIDDRCAFDKVEQTQPFFTGFFNTDTEVALYDRYVNLFSGAYEIDDVIELGNKVLESQRVLVRERVLKNAKRVELSDGKPAVVVESPELVNMTHDEIHKRFPDSSVTIVVNMKLPSDKLTFSLRSFDTHRDVGQMARKIGGDGKQACAGGSMSWTLPIPF